MKNEIIIELDEAGIEKNEHNVYIMYNKFNGKTYITKNGDDINYCIENGSGKEIKYGKTNMVDKKWWI